MTATPNTAALQAPKLKDCPICDGTGYLSCDCWPCDCICGYGDETCEECSGHGFIDPDDDYGYNDGMQT